MKLNLGDLPRTVINSVKTRFTSNSESGFKPTPVEEEFIIQCIESGKNFRELLEDIEAANITQDRLDGVTQEIRNRIMDRVLSKERQVG